MSNINILNNFLKKLTGGGLDGEEDGELRISIFGENYSVFYNPNITNPDDEGSPKLLRVFINQIEKFNLSFVNGYNPNVKIAIQDNTTKEIFETTTPENSFADELRVFSTQGPTPTPLPTRLINTPTSTPISTIPIVNPTTPIVTLSPEPPLTTPTTTNSNSAPNSKPSPTAFPLTTENEVVPPHLQTFLNQHSNSSAEIIANTSLAMEQSYFDSFENSNGRQKLNRRGTSYTEINGSKSLVNIGWSNGSGGQTQFCLLPNIISFKNNGVDSLVIDTPSGTRSRTKITTHISFGASDDFTYNYDSGKIVIRRGVFEISKDGLVINGGGAVINSGGLRVVKGETSIEANLKIGSSGSSLKVVTQNGDSSVTINGINYYSKSQIDALLIDYYNRSTSYALGVAQAAESSAKSHATTVAQAAESSAKSHATTAAQTAESNAKTYAVAQDSTFKPTPTPIPTRTPTPIPTRTPTPTPTK
jgi:hypothetical protein